MEASDEPNLAVAVGAAILVGVVLAVLAVRGVFSRRAFEGSPQRPGTLGVFDIAIVLGLLIVGQAVAIGAVSAAPFLPDDEQGRMLYGMLAGYVGAIPSLVYLLFRAATAVEGGLGTFGFGVGRPGLTLAVTLLGVLAIFPLTLGVAALSVQLSLWLGDPAPGVAHETLRVIREDPAGPTALGLIVTAVVVAPLLEEIVFRGLLQTVLLHTGWIQSRWVAIIGASLLFTLVHLGVLMVPNEQAEDGPVPTAPAVAQSEPAEQVQPDITPDVDDDEQAEDADDDRRLAWQALPGLFVLSLGLGYLYERTGSLWPPILMHMLFNGSQIYVALNVLQ